MLGNLSAMFLVAAMLMLLGSDATAHKHASIGEQPLSKIAIDRAGEDTEWVDVKLQYNEPAEDDWVGVFSPANFNSSSCPDDEPRQQMPFICSAPIKYRFANESNSDYLRTGNASLKFKLINQRADFSFALFFGGLSNPKLVAVSGAVSFANPKAPRLAQGKSWNEMTVTWTSGYNINEAIPLVEWGLIGELQTLSPAGTETFHRNSMCGPPARTVGWRDPGFIHTSFLQGLWPNSVYTYRLGHKLFGGSYIWSKNYSFRSSPYPGQDSLHRVVIFGDMGKAEHDGSNEYSNYQPGSLNTTDQLIKDISNTDTVFHIGDITYAYGYISQCDQFTAQVEPIASSVPIWLQVVIMNVTHQVQDPSMIAETMFYVPAGNRSEFWYSTDYGMFHFCIADSELDWREAICLSDHPENPWERRASRSFGKNTKWI